MTPDDLIARLRRDRPSLSGGDHVLDPTAPPIPPNEDKPLVPAAVLVPVIDGPNGLSVLFTQRTSHLAHHPGQISFPGGRLEDGDYGDYVHAALRETEEEIGLDRSHVRILGRLDLYRTGTGFLVAPVVGLIQPPFDLSLDAFEVAEAFEVPLSHLLTRSQYRLEPRVVAGRSRPFWAIQWQDRLIWGATAGMLVNFCDVLGVP